DKRHDARVPVFSRIGHERETADHVAAHDVVQRAAGRVRSLPGEHLVVVAVIGRALLAGAIALRGGAGGELAQRALVRAGLRRPIKTVLLARPADDALRIDSIAANAPLGIFLLGVDISETGLDRVQFVAADAAIEDLLAAGRGIEPPGAVL